MGKLTNLKPSLGMLRPSAVYVPQGEAERRRYKEDQSWRRWYKTSRWRALRAAVLLRDLFTCQMPGCGRIESNTSMLVADHRTPHRGDERLFWDETNVQCLCKPCHDGRKQREEHRSRSRVG